VRDLSPAGQRPDRRRCRRDLRAGPIPAAALEQWRDTEAALTQLYRNAESRAIDAIDWYLADKRGKRIWPRGLRLERRLEQLRCDWAAECRLALLRSVSDDMAALMRQETAAWVLDLQSDLLRLETSTGGSWSSARGRSSGGREGDGSRVPAGRGRPPSRRPRPAGGGRQGR
jgi:hypothetical protein